MSDPGIKAIALCANAWRTPEDFYRALLPGLGAPDWHGHNLDALHDSLSGGRINRLAPPFHVRVAGTEALSDEMRAFLAKVRRVFDDCRPEVEASISFEPPL